MARERGIFFRKTDKLVSFAKIIKWVLLYCNLTQNQLAEIYCTSRENITMHIMIIISKAERSHSSSSAVLSRVWAGKCSQAAHGADTPLRQTLLTPEFLITTYLRVCVTHWIAISLTDILMLFLLPSRWSSTRDSLSWIMMQTSWRSSRDLEILKSWGNPGKWFKKSWGNRGFG